MTAPATGCPRRPAALFVANRWIDAKGQVRQWLDGRAPLPEGLAAGASATIALDVKAPDEKGRWVLEVDLVDEGVSWFQEQGSTPCQLELSVV